MGIDDNGCWDRGISTEPKYVIHTCEVCGNQVSLEFGLYVKCPKCEARYNTLNRPMVVKVTKLINPTDLTPKKETKELASDVDNIISEV